VTKTVKDATACTTINVYNSLHLWSYSTASEVTTLWRYRNECIIILLLLLLLLLQFYGKCQP